MSQQRILLPHDPVEAKPRLGSGSRWTRVQLELLNVEYEPTHEYRFDFEDIVLPPAVQEGGKSPYLPTEILGVDEVCRGMEAMDMEAVRRSKVNWIELQKSWPCLAFSTAYERLSSILEKGQSSSSRRSLSAYTTPPTQTSIPVNPKYSNESENSYHTISSGDDKRENYTELFANELSTASLTVFRLYAGNTISWLNPLYDLCISPRFVLSSLPL